MFSPEILKIQRHCTFQNYVTVNKEDILKKIRKLLSAYNIIISSWSLP